MRRLALIREQYPQFKKTLEAPIVLLDLKLLKKHSGDMIAALSPKVSAKWVDFLGLGKGLLDTSFDNAIAVYSQ